MLKIILLILFISFHCHAEDGFILKTLSEEMNRSFSKLKKADIPAYFVSYTVTDVESTVISASYGALENTSEEKYRYLDVEMRVGDYKLDNTHRFRDRSFSFSDTKTESGFITVENDASAFKMVLWIQTDEAYKNAVEKLLKLKSEKLVKVEEEDTSPDFSNSPREIFIEDVAPLSFNKKEWEEKLKKLSAIFKSYPDIHDSGLRFSIVRSVKYLINTEGTKIQTGRNHVHLTIQAETTADDGMELELFENFDGSTLDKIPDDKTLSSIITKMSENLTSLRKAPLAEPYSGPAILSGKASAVFFHEVLGHRLEGHRQKDEKEGQTFTKKVGEKILPDFVSVYDDPTLFSIEGIDLNGNYKYDDEGVKAEKTILIEKGVLKNFLMSRSPIKGFSNSNGHGRKQYGYRTVARQGNLIVEPEKTVSEDELRKELKELIKKEKKMYGLFFKEIQGGFTFTGRVRPNAFNVKPVLVYKVFPDERPDELVRGVDLIGTPLTPISKILFAGGKTEIFNGYCGAESGYIPISAISPSLLIGEIEVQKKEKSEDRPPILKPPLYDK